MLQTWLWAYYGLFDVNGMIATMGAILKPHFNRKFLR